MFLAFQRETSIMSVRTLQQNTDETLPAIPQPAAADVSDQTILSADGAEDTIVNIPASTAALYTDTSADVDVESNMMSVDGQVQGHSGDGVNTSNISLEDLNSTRPDYNKWVLEVVLRHWVTEN